MILVIVLVRSTNYGRRENKETQVRGLNIVAGVEVFECLF